MRLTLAAAASLMLLPTLPALAQAPARLRGTIASVSDAALIVHMADGADLTVTLTPETTIRTDTLASPTAIKPGAILAIVSKGDADHQQAVAIRVMAPPLTLRQGVSPWDLMPESTMTNAVVEGQSVATDGRSLTLKAGDRPVSMEIAPNASIALEEQADRGALAPGAKVVVFATQGNETTMTARTVIVGKGMTPPV